MLSAKRLAPSLVPVLLYPGRRNAFIDWFEAQGGLAFQHRTSLLHRWQVRRSSALPLPIRVSQRQASRAGSEPPWAPGSYGRVRPAFRMVHRCPVQMPALCSHKALERVRAFYGYKTLCLA